jgi:ABC-type thiamine transport system ATPase subunit
MTISFIICNSVPEFKKFVEKNITETQATLGIQMKQIGLARKKYEEAKKAAGVSGLNQKLPMTGVKKTTIAGFNVLLNPSLEHELNLMEEAFSSLQEKLNTFEQVKNLYPTLSDERMKVGIVLEGGLPVAFMLYHAK